MQDKNDSIPILKTYGEAPPTYVPPGMTKEQVRNSWLCELNKTRPEWYDGDKTEDVTPR